MINNLTLDVFLNRFPKNNIKQFSLIYKKMRQISDELRLLKKSSPDTPVIPVTPAPDSPKAPTFEGMSNYTQIDNAANGSLAEHHPEISATLHAADQRLGASARLLAPYSAGYFGEPKLAKNGMIVHDILGSPQLGQVVRGHRLGKKTIVEGSPDFIEDHKKIKYYLKLPNQSILKQIDNPEIESPEKKGFLDAVENSGASRYASFFKDGDIKKDLSDAEHQSLKEQLSSDDGFLWKHFVATHPLTHFTHFLSGLAPHITEDNNVHDSISAICDDMKRKIAYDYTALTDKTIIKDHMLRSLDEARNPTVTASVDKPIMPSIQFFKTKDKNEFSVRASYDHLGQKSYAPIDAVKFASLFDNSKNIFSDNDFTELVASMVSPEKQASLFGSLKFENGFEDAPTPESVSSDEIEKGISEKAQQTLDRDRLPFKITRLKNILNTAGLGKLTDSEKINLLRTIKNLQVQSSYGKIRDITDAEISSRPIRNTTSEEFSPYILPRIHPFLDRIIAASPDIKQRYPSLYRQYDATTKEDAASAQERHEAHQDLYLRALVSSLPKTDPKSYVSAIGKDDFDERIASLKALLPDGASAPWDDRSGPFLSIAHDQKPSLIISPSFEYFLKNLEQHSMNPIPKQPFVSANALRAVLGGISGARHAELQHTPLGIFHAIDELQSEQIKRKSVIPNTKTGATIDLTDQVERIIRPLIERYSTDTVASPVAPFREEIPQIHIEDALSVLNSDAKELFTSLINGNDRRVHVVNVPGVQTITQGRDPRNQVARVARRIPRVDTSAQTPFAIRPGPYGVTFRQSPSGNGVMIPEFRMIYRQINPVTGKHELVMPTKSTDVQVNQEPWQNTIEQFTAPVLPAPEPVLATPPPSGTTIRDLAGLSALLASNAPDAMAAAMARARGLIPAPAPAPAPASAPASAPAAAPDDENFIMFPHRDSDDGDGLISGPIHEAHVAYLKLRQSFFNALFERNAHILNSFLPDTIEQASLGIRNLPAPVPQAIGLGRRGRRITAVDPGLVPL